MGIQYLDDFIHFEKLLEQWEDSLFEVSTGTRKKRSKERYLLAIRRYRKLKELGYSSNHSARTACDYDMQSEWTHAAAVEGPSVRKPAAQYADNLLTSAINQGTGEKL